MEEEELTGCSKYPEFPWESQYQYRCRVFKIKEYLETLGELRATALANVWANHHFLGCSYPTSVMDAIKHWKHPPKNEELEEKLAEMQRLEKEAMYDETLVNANLNLKDLKFKLYYSAFTEQPPAVVLIYNSSQACKVPCSFVENEGLTEGLRSVSLFINDVHVSDGRGDNCKEAKHACAENALKYMKKKGLTIISPMNIEEEAISHVSKDSLVDKSGTTGEHMENKIQDDNIGCKLLKAMGWSTDTGLGKDGQGMVNPIGTVGQTNRGGLGSHNSEAGICHQTVKQQLLDFVMDPNLMKLEFSNELDNLERKMIHRLSERYGLKHKSRGSGVNRKLMVWKEEESVSDILAEPVVQFDEEYGEEDQMVTDEIATEANLDSLSLRDLQQHQIPGEASIVPGKRKKHAASAQSKVSRTTNNVSFDYNQPSSSKHGNKKPPYQRIKGRGGRGSSETGFYSASNPSKRTRPVGPFREGYVDPYLSEPPRESYRRVGFQSGAKTARSTYRRPGFENGQMVQGAGFVPDPRTHHSSGFGIYRHMRFRK